MENNGISAAKRVSRKLSNIISNSLSVSELKIYNKAEKADALSFDAIYLSVLKNAFGFTAEQLKEVFSAVCSASKQYESYSLSGNYIPQVEELKNYGFDLETASKEAAIWQ